LDTRSAEYLSALALFLVVMTISDFRVRYRLSHTKTDLRKVGFWIALGIGGAILFVDLWFQNGLPVPKIFANPNNLKVVLALILLIFVFRIISVAIMWPPVFDKSNARRFFETNYHFIQEGNVDRPQVITEKLLRSLKKVIAVAAEAPEEGSQARHDERRPARYYAVNFLLLIGDRRFCDVVVNTMPAFALNCLLNVQKHPTREFHIFQFARNIGQEFIRNTSSSFYQ
jgi:hypothetical protein